MALFYILFMVCSLILLLSGIYEWDWVWRTARGGYLPDKIGKANTRLLYIFLGLLCISSLFAFMLKDLAPDYLIFILSLAFFALITNWLFNKYEGTSVMMFIKSRKSSLNDEATKK
jgi:uncharacterized membrane-anchored protein YitT (DUF2179 family)